jgi:hypothetical protein
MAASLNQEPNQIVWFLLAIFPVIGALTVGLITGWLLGKERKKQAAAALLIGGVLVFAIYTAMFAQLGVFSIRNEIR